MVERISEFSNTSTGEVILTMLLFAVLAFCGCKLFLFVVDRISKRVDPTALHWKLLKQFIKIVWVVIFIIGVVESVPGFSKLGTALVACSSVIVAALGLASQDALGNAIDGIFISLFKPFAVGDRIRLVGRNITGIVTDINLRYTLIRTVENNLLMIPNSIMNDEIIENSNIVDTKIKTFLDVEISYDSDVQKAKQILTDLVINHPLFVDIRSSEDIENGVEPVTILIRNLTANGVELRVTLCSANINDSFKLCSDIREQLLISFKENGISIPYQTIEIIKHENITEKGQDNEYRDKE